MGHIQVTRQGSVWGKDGGDRIEEKNILFTRKGLLPRLWLFFFFSFPKPETGKKRNRKKSIYGLRFK